MRTIKIILSAVLISGCSVKQTDKNTIHIRLREDPTTLDPAYIVDVAGGSVSAKLYGGLVKIDPSGKIISDIAESWKISEDGLTYTFKLNQDADPVKKSFEKVVKESPRKWIFDKVKEFRVRDKNILQIILRQPFSPFLSMLTMPNAYVCPGPYELIEWEHDKKITLLKNRDRHLFNIEYQIIPEEFTAQTEFDLGNLDIMEVSPIQWKGVLRDKKRKVKQFSQVGLNTYYIGFDCRKPLFQNYKFRQALNYAIDRKAIINSIIQGQAIPAWGPVPPPLLKNKETYQYAYLPNKARKIFNTTMLEMPIKLYVRAQAQAIQIAEVVQYYLSKIGVRVIIIPLEWSAFKKAIDDGEADLFLMSWWADYPDPENFLFPTFHSGNFGAGGNRSYFKNKKIDKMIEIAQREMDPVKRDKLYTDLQRLISRQAPWIFLWNAKELYVTQPWIEGFRLYPIYNVDKGKDIKVRETE